MAGTSAGLSNSATGVDKNQNYDGRNLSRGLLDPVNAIIKLVGKAYWAPAGSHWADYENPGSEALITEIFNELDEEKRLALFRRRAGSGI